ncbi:hypothetical protein [Oceanobacillus sojae]|uniref:Uncharacterized protein n=1 Tax=Oceanobacillus sojae TaxID=582851 RepID=A0A511ZID6_9BACI|nr:hypothetical protein [Oceanobacillus sojae]GEN87204.1 hypothetical protein OSO01_19430 [Oceanobacillus sojae]
MKSFFIEHWVFLIATIVSIFSIYYSNYLGRKANFSEYKLNLEKDRYNNFYLPIIKHLYSFDSEHLKFNVTTLGNLTGDLNYLEKHIRSNFEYISPEVALLYTKYQPLAGRLFINNELELVDEVDALFKKIIRQVLIEASELSETLEVPNLAQQLLKNLY